MKTFILLLVIPAFISFYAFSNAQSAFADAHHLYSLYCWTGWISAAWVVGFLGYRFYQTKKTMKN